MGVGPVKVKGQGFTGRPGEPSDHHANLTPGKGDREEDRVARTSDMDAAPGSSPQPRGAACEDSLGTSNRKIRGWSVLETQRHLVHSRYLFFI